MSTSRTRTEAARVPGVLSTLIRDYQTQLLRHRNRPFLEATMAACALVASADGEVSFGERIRVDQILAALDALNIYDSNEAVNLFNDFVERIFSSPRDGHNHALRAVKTVSGDAEKAELLVRIFLAICETGEHKSLVKQIEVVMLCGILNIEPDNCGLYIDDTNALLD
jgi:tellurite resistance protein